MELDGSTTENLKKNLKLLSPIFHIATIVVKTLIVLFVICVVGVAIASVIVGFVVNKKFFGTLIPDALVALLVGFYLRDIKEYVETAEKFMRFLNSVINGTITPEMLKDEFDDFKHSVFKGAKMVVIGPCVTVIVIGIIGIITGSLLLKFVGNTDHTVWIISIVIIVVAGVAVVVGIPALVISYFIYLWMKPSIAQSMNELENDFQVYLDRHFSVASNTQETVQLDEV